MVGTLCCYMCPNSEKMQSVAAFTVTRDTANEVSWVSHVQKNKVPRFTQKYAMYIILLITLSNIIAQHFFVYKTMAMVYKHKTGSRGQRVRE